MSGTKMSEETKKKISETLKGKKKAPFSEEHKKNISEAKKGFKHTQETKDRISRLNKGKKKPPRTEEHKRKLGEAHKGKVHTEEWKKAMSNRNFGEKNPCWKGGGTCHYFRKMAFEVYKMPKVCEMCGSTVRISVHHKDMDKTNNTKENLSILCNRCHARHHYYGGDVLDPNIRMYSVIPGVTKDIARVLVDRFPYFTDFMDIWIQKDYPISKLTKSQVDNIPILEDKSIQFLNKLCRPLEEPILVWYGEKEEAGI